MNYPEEDTLPSGAPVGVERVAKTPSQAAWERHTLAAVFLAWRDLGSPPVNLRQVGNVTLFRHPHGGTVVADAVLQETARTVIAEMMATAAKHDRSKRR
jgi:hypothetical protein